MKMENPLFYVATIMTVFLFGLVVAFTWCIRTDAGRDWMAKILRKYHNGTVTFRANFGYYIGPLKPDEWHKVVIWFGEDKGALPEDCPQITAYAILNQTHTGFSIVGGSLKPGKDANPEQIYSWSCTCKDCTWETCPNTPPEYRALMQARKEKLP